MTDTAVETVDLKTACRMAVKLLDPAAKAGVRTKLAEQYEREWVAELARRREVEQKAAEAAERARLARVEAQRKAKLVRDRQYRARKRRERYAAQEQTVLETLYGFRSAA